ncbi:Mor transcription activator family protein [Stenotrophomonas sp.]|uniref:Mor transcription activator family protein n=1 Tax=Stenotrophomonas sp. TaxID=69392 RepID=UPI0025E8C002|nr:Mor transcription activator family protein [Stenotrophomonas sp.]
MTQPELKLEHGSGTLSDADLDALPKERWPRDLVAAIEVQEAAFVRLGHDEDEAFKLARAGVLALAEYGGGRDWYLPRGDTLMVAVRDAEIYRRAHRGNIAALAAEFRLTERHIWRICRQQYALHIRKIQPPLFPE